MTLQIIWVILVFFLFILDQFDYILIKKYKELLGYVTWSTSTVTLTKLMNCKTLVYFIKDSKNMHTNKIENDWNQQG